MSFLGFPLPLLTCSLPMCNASKLCSNQDECAISLNLDIGNANPIEASCGNLIDVIELVVQHHDFLLSVDHNVYVKSSYCHYICPPSRSQDISSEVFSDFPCGV